MSAIAAPRVGLTRNVPGPVPAVVVSAALATVALVFGWRGGDLAAQVYRADLVRHYGVVLWSNLWFGGHPTLDYSVLVPMVGAVIGPVLLGAVCSVASAFLVERLLRAHFGASAAVGALWFAVSTVTNLAVGRVTFGAGLALGLGALLGLQRNRPWTAATCGLLCALASPVAGVLLIIIAGAWGSAQRARLPMTVAVIAATLLPLVTIAVLFPSSGVFPFEGWLLMWTLFVCAGLVIALPREQVVLRRGIGLYALACLAAFAVPNPLGGNITRLAQYGAAPILACALWPARRLILMAAAVPLLVWQWVPAIDGIALAGRDPSTRASFYTPLVEFLHSEQTSPSRIEIPVTRHHWESVYVGDTQSLARGWERQLDMGFNKIFYDKAPLNAVSYESWLANMGVEYVALPNAPLDDTSTAEARLLTSGLPFLTPVWTNRDWRVWRYDANPGLVSGPATLTQISADSFTVNVTKPGDIVVRVRASAHWSVPKPGCVADDGHGWTVLRGLPTGINRVSQALGGSPCG
jgi:hypothetical protein